MYVCIYVYIICITLTHIYNKSDLSYDRNIPLQQARNNGEIKNKLMFLLEFPHSLDFWIV